MRINRTGATRIVIECNSVVIKLPNILNGWHHFLLGILANINENKCWKWNSGTFEKGHSHLLCPVLWCSWGGWILVMKKVDSVLTLDEGWELDILPHIKHFPGDDSGNNYGFLDGRIVKIDYGSLNTD
jgi:hypothetical protein